MRENRKQAHSAVAEGGLVIPIEDNPRYNKIMRARIKAKKKIFNSYWKKEIDEILTFAAYMEKRQWKNEWSDRDNEHSHGDYVLGVGKNSAYEKDLNDKM